MKRLLSLLLIAFAAAPVQAQTVPPTVQGVLDISWVLPTESDCLQPAPAECVRVQLVGEYAVTAVQLYISSSPIPDDFVGTPSATVVEGETSIVYNTAVPNGSTAYIRARAVNQFGASVMSDQVSKLILAEAKPGKPTGLTVNFTLQLPNPTP